MWLGAESNRRHEDFQSSALPTELPSRREKPILGLFGSRGCSLCNNPSAEQEEASEPISCSLFRRWVLVGCDRFVSRRNFEMELVAQIALQVTQWMRPFLARGAD